MTLRIFAITKPGLVALTVSVAALWTCVGLEQNARRKAVSDTMASIRILSQLRQTTANPVTSSPARLPLRAFHVQRPSTS